MHQILRPFLSLFSGKHGVEAKINIMASQLILNLSSWKRTIFFKNFNPFFIMMIIDHIKTCLLAIFSLVNCVLSSSLWEYLIH